VSSPVIVWQTFGRMSSLSAEMFFHQHINRVCDGVILGEDKVTVFKPGPDYGIGIVGKWLGPTTSKEPTKDGA